ncbi:hypothetical protein [Dongia sp.]|uniref:hypothetical protein n=1 Tax=Dongia sp. TaxID=1977262 RepID=UPI0034A2D963
MANTQTNGQGAINIEAEGSGTIRIQAVPGATVNLPFGDNEIIASLAENGNLAISSKDQTIILLGYAEANQVAPVTITTGGRPIDIADVIAATVNAGDKMHRYAGVKLHQ